MDYYSSFDNFLSGGSTDASCKVWCKLLKSPRRSSEKYFFPFDTILRRESYRKIQLNSESTEI